MEGKMKLSQDILFTLYTIVKLNVFLPRNKSMKTKLKTYPFAS